MRTGVEHTMTTMPDTPNGSALRPGQRLLAAFGALLAGSAVGLSAYAAHGVEVAARANLQTAAFFAFGHGVALAALVPMARRRWTLVALALLAIGVTLFSGSLMSAQLFATSTRLAPAGGTMLMLGWLLWAIDALRR